MRAVLLFPGQGAQRPGMTAGWSNDAHVREAVAMAEDVLSLPLGRWMQDGPADELTRTEHAQPALLALGLGAARRMRADGLEPVAAAGHSLGEITALAAAEALSYPDALRLTHLRGRAMQAAVAPGEGAMTALLGLDEAKIPEALAAGAAHGVVVAANENAPGQIVLSGDAPAVAAAAEAAKSLGARKAIPLQVSAPFTRRAWPPPPPNWPPFWRRSSSGRPPFPSGATPASRPTPTTPPRFARRSSSR